MSINKKYGLQHREHCKMKGNVYDCDNCKHQPECKEGILHKKLNKVLAPMMNKALSELFE